MTDKQFNQSKKTALYVITAKADGRDARAQAIISLRDEFYKAELVYSSRRRDDKHKWAIRPWRNPLTVLRLIGLESFATFLASWLFFPSAERLFTYAVRRKLRKAIKRDLHQGLDVTIVLTVPPHALVLLGKYLKLQIPQIRLIVDWQDLWSFDETYFLRVPRVYRKRLLRLEQSVMELADVNITTNERARDNVILRHNLPAAKVTAIHHHFYDADRPDKEQQSEPLTNRPEEISIGFLGNLFKPPKVRGDKVLACIDEIANDIPVVLHILGDTTKDAASAISQVNNPCTQLYEPLPLRKALQRLSVADMVILTLEDLPNCKTIMHGKLPHYLILGVPIVALVPQDSYVADVVRQTNTGIVLSQDSSWTQELAGFAASVRDNKYCIAPDHQAIAQFEWTSVSSEWKQALTKQT